MTTAIERKTVFSKCRLYRYVLWREWGATDPVRDLLCSTERKRDDCEHIGQRDQFCQFLCLNPSTADETKDDPTVRRCIDYAKRWGFGALCVANIFAFRATDPNEMKWRASPIGDDNDDWILRIAKEAGMVVAAWGKDGKHLDRQKEVLTLLAAAGVNVHCLKKNADGSPQHPLYLPKHLTPIPYE